MRIHQFFKERKQFQQFQQIVFNFFFSYLRQQIHPSTNFHRLKRRTIRAHCSNSHAQANNSKNNNNNKITTVNKLNSACIVKEALHSHVNHELVKSDSKTHPSFPKYLYPPNHPPMNWTTLTQKLTHFSPNISTHP